LLFSSNPFLFVFLPITLLGYQLLSRFGRKPLLCWMTLVSLFFYGFWNPKYLILLGFSMLMNFGFSFLVAAPDEGRPDGRTERSRSLWLTIAIVVDVALLMYYKYLFPFLNFFYKHHVLPHGFQEIVLPLGISFFTFTQIAYLIDVRQEIARRQPLIPYSVFVTFFPHLIAGPIIHPRELMPQYDEGRIGPLKSPDVALGLTWFILGLAKKVLIADRMAPLADVMYAHVHSAGIATSWLGALCYSLQLYFDFSGYSDMALGLARMFSLEFPINFHSPFKAQSIIEFWAHWHMTLTRYLNEYVYTPILRWVNSRRIDAGKKTNRKAAATPEGFIEIVIFPTMTTMFISGIWHGVGLEFITFGLIHGVFLCVNHAWRLLTPGTRLHRAVPAPVMVLITYACVLVGHVFFRANTFSDACYVLGSMIGLHQGPAFADFQWLGDIPHISSFLTHARSATLAVLGCFFICWAMPNTQEILNQLPEGYIRLPSLLPRWSWRMTPAWSAAIMFLFCASILLLDSSTRFLYFQF
jgi:alginate O-acetyltransferase complex protein AlgI